MLKSKGTKSLLLVLLSSLLTASAIAQETKADKSEPKFYKLDFVLKEVDGKRILNSRTYSILASTGSNSSIRAREQTRLNQSTTGGPMWQDVEVGADIDTRNILPVGNDLALVVAANITGLPQGAENGGQAIVVRKLNWNSQVLLPLRRPTLLFSSDLTTGKTQMQLELTAMPLP